MNLSSKDKIINIFCTIFIINTFIILFLYKILYRMYIDIGSYNGSLINNLINSIYYSFIIIFIIVIVDLLIDLWIKKKYKVKILSSIVIIIFILLNIFSAPFNYIIYKSETYKLDNLLTIIDFHSNENDFEGGKEIKKYIYIPFSNKLIIIDGLEISVKKINTKELSIVDDYYDES